MELEDKIEDILDKKLVILDLDATTKEDAISKLADVLYKNGKLLSKEIYIRDVLEREKHCTTGIGSGISIPHGKSEGVKETSIAIGKLSKPVDWEAFDEMPVKMVFLISVKKEDAEEKHLRILSHIATALVEDEIINRLLVARTSEEILDLLCG